jgi:hypothetical protein
VSIAVWFPELEAKPNQPLGRIEILKAWNRSIWLNVGE